MLAQRYRPIEIIIVDDGSTDETPQVVEELAASHEVRSVHQGNAGPGAAREAGRQLACGAFIQYLDSDDLLLPTKFELQVGRWIETRARRFATAKLNSINMASSHRIYLGSVLESKSNECSQAFYPQGGGTRLRPSIAEKSSMPLGHGYRLGGGGLGIRLSDCEQRHKAELLRRIRFRILDWTKPLDRAAQRLRPVWRTVRKRTGTS